MSYKHEWSVVLNVFIYAESIIARTELIKYTKTSLIEIVQLDLYLQVNEDTCG